MHLFLLLILVLCALLVRAGQAQVKLVQEDSLAVKEMHRPFDIENDELRVLAKMASGTGWGFVLTTTSMFVLDIAVERKDDPDADAYRTLGLLLFSGSIGCTVGFPLGVTAVDPYDSLPLTLLAGVIPGTVGIGLIMAGNETGFAVSYVGPVVSSLIVSEIWRKMSQDRRVSFGFSPTFNKGPSVVTTLHF